MDPNQVPAQYETVNHAPQTIFGSTPPAPVKKSRKKLYIIGAIIAGLVIAGFLPFLLSTGIVNAKAWVVSPTGTSSADGTSVDSAISLQTALDRALPGDVIQLQPGVYNVSTTLKTKRNGEPNKPITIKGSEMGLNISGRNKTVISGKGHIFDVDHNYYTFDGFTINGQPNLNFNDIPTSPSDIIAYKNANQSKISDGRLIYIGNTTKGVKGTVINNMFLTGAGGECIRMRSFATQNVVSNSYIYRCGFLKKDKPYPYHNGEGVYIGTSTKSTDQPYYQNDDSSANIVKNNIINTMSSECVNIKDNASGNVVDSNECRNGLGPDSESESILEVRGKNNFIVNNIIQHSNGYGIKLWSDAAEYGGGNIIAGNQLSDIHSAQITVKGQPQPKEVCENTFDTPTPILQGLTDTDVFKHCSQSYSDTTSTPDPEPISEPTILSLSPSKGSQEGGYTVTIKIANFTSGKPVVMFGSQTSSVVQRIDSSTVTAKVPSSTRAATVPVLVQLDDKSANMPFTYEAKVVSTTPTPDPEPTPVPTPDPTPSPSPLRVTYLSDEFENLSQITSVRGGTWKVSSLKELQLADPKDDLSVGNSNIATFNKTLPQAYEVTLQAKVKGTDNKFNDMSLLFDYKDTSNYSFVSFNESNDSNTSGIFTVREGKVTQVSDITTAITSDKYYSVVMSHSAKGVITVKLDGNTVAEAHMESMPGNKIGVGSRNDSARFDDISVKSLQ